MLERVSLIRKRYPGTKVSVYKLRKLYRQHKIKRKCIQATKIPTPIQRDKILL